MKENKKSIIGWIGVIITLIFASLWAYWGAIENFHEGWYSTSFWENLFMLVFQYLLPTTIFTLLAVAAIKWKKIGLILHIALASFCIWFFSGASFNVLGLLINAYHCACIALLLRGAKTEKMGLPFADIRSVDYYIGYLDSAGHQGIAENKRRRFWYENC